MSIRNSPSHSGGLECGVALESFGVTVRIEASSRELLQEAIRTAENALVGRMRVIGDAPADHVFGIVSDANGATYLFRNGEQISYDTGTSRFFKFFDSILRITVAEFAVGWVFIHAGVVAWQNKAIVLPANSFRGKTTLVTELVKAGAEYYSDEYAVLDANGLVHPYARKLSIRHTENGEVKENSVDIKEFGGQAATTPAPVGLVVITEYEDGGIFEPERLSVGQGILEVIPHTIPRNFNAEFSLKVLNTALSDAIILRSRRGDASDVVSKLLSFF